MPRYDYDAFTTSLPSPYMATPTAKTVAVDVVASLAIAISLALAVPASVIGLYVALFVP